LAGPGSADNTLMGDVLMGDVLMGDVLIYDVLMRDVLMGDVLNADNIPQARQLRLNSTDKKKRPSGRSLIINYQLSIIN
jgi:hypothetical protein